MADGWGAISDWVNSIPTSSASDPGDANRNGIPDWIENWDPTGGGGGGGGSSVDHFFDLSPMDEFNIFHTNRVFDATQQMNQVNAALDQAALNHKILMDQANLALANGELGLARQKAADANHWQSVSAGLEQQRIGLQQAAIQSEQAIAQMRDATDRRGQDLSFSATTRGQDVTAAGNVDQARLGVLRDETDRLLGQQGNQVSQFANETNRQVGLGNLGLDINRFLLENASQPDNLFSTFLLQRGISPDFPTMRSGGTLPTGDPIVPVNPLSLYTPTTVPDFNIPAQSALAGQVGAASEGILNSPAQMPAGAGGAPDYSGIMGFPNLAGSGSAAPIPMPPAIGGGGTGVASSAPSDPLHAPQIAGQPGSILPPGPAGQTIAATGTNKTYPDAWSGVRIGDINPGFNLLTTGTAGPTTVGDFDPRLQLFLGTGPNATRLTDPRQAIPGGTPLGIIAPQDWSIPALSFGGVTRAPVARVGDRPDGKPSKNEEVLINPTRAPIMVVPNKENVKGVPRYALGTLSLPPPPDQLADLGLDAGTLQGLDIGSFMSTVNNAQLMRSGVTPQVYQSMLSDRDPNTRYQASQYLGLEPGSYNTRFELANLSNPGGPRRGRVRSGATTQPGQAATTTAASPTSTSNPEMMPGPIIEEDFGIPTDQGIGQVGDIGIQAVGAQPELSQDEILRQQYEAAGLGHLLLPSSQNLQLLNDPRTSQLLKQLGSYGIPISPALAALTGGYTPDNLNVQLAAAGRGLGMAPSLQQLNRLAPGEFRHFKDLIQGPGGIAFDDYLASIRQPTQYLRSAASARMVR